MAKKSIIAGEATKQRSDGATKGKRRNVEGSKRKPKAPAVPALTIERVPVEQLKRAAYNPRVELSPGDPEYEKLKRSIAEFGYVESIVWNRRSGNLVGGHQRLSVLVNEHAVAEVDVSVVDLPPAKEKALNVALNKIAGRWDDLKLSALLLELKEEDAAAAELTGFDELELKALLAEQQQEMTTMTTAPAAEIAVSDKYSVMVTCKSEADQKQVYDTLRQKGYACRVLTI